jgi:hypothetical protein
MQVRRISRVITARRCLAARVRGVLQLCVFAGWLVTLLTTPAFMQMYVCTRRVAHRSTITISQHKDVRIISIGPHATPKVNLEPKLNGLCYKNLSPLIVNIEKLRKLSSRCARKRLLRV